MSRLRHCNAPAVAALARRGAAAAAVAVAGLLFVLACGGAAAQPSAKAGRAVIGIVLEPPGLDPTAAPAASIGEIVHDNVLEGLTKIEADGRVTPLLAERWTVAPDGRSVTFTLRRGVKFHDGEAFDAADVKFSFERARAPGSTNKAKAAVFDNITAIATPDPATVTLTLAHPDGDLLFRLGENTAVILDPKSAAGTATAPVGTGPFRFESWRKGTSVTLAKWAGFRDAAHVALSKVTFRFINDPSAQVAALLAGDVDAFPRGIANQSLGQFEADPRFTVTTGASAGKGILAINNRRKPLDDVRVRRALAYAIDRKAFIDGVLDGYGRPIGSHFTPTDAGYVDLTSLYPHDPAKARALLKEAGVALPLLLTLTLPPAAYARKGGEVIAAQLAQVGVRAKIENVEWAQWLSGAFQGRFDLTVINHVEPLDYLQYANPGYYWGYDSAAFRALARRHAASTDAAERTRLFAELQRLIATDAVNAFIFNPANVSVARRGLEGLWKDSPIFVNDMAAVRWR